jgi:hypothetical protein
MRGFLLTWARQPASLVSALSHSLNDHKLCRVRQAVPCDMGQPQSLVVSSRRYGALSSGTAETEVPILQTLLALLGAVLAPICSTPQCKQTP